MSKPLSRLSFWVEYLLVLVLSVSEGPAGGASGLYSTADSLTSPSFRTVHVQAQVYLTKLIPALF